MIFRTNYHVAAPQLVPQAPPLRAEAVGDEREGQVADALGPAVALECELGDGREAREEAWSR